MRVKRNLKQDTSIVSFIEELKNVLAFSGKTYRDITFIDADYDDRNNCIIVTVDFVDR